MFQWFADAAASGSLTVSGCSVDSVGSSIVAIYTSAAADGALTCLTSDDTSCSNGPNFGTHIEVQPSTYYWFVVGRSPAALTNPITILELDFQPLGTWANPEVVPAQLPFTGAFLDVSGAAPTAAGGGTHSGGRGACLQPATLHAHAGPAATAGRTPAACRSPADVASAAAPHLPTRARLQTYLYSPAGFGPSTSCFQMFPQDPQYTYS